jgi:hypothetical protein
VSDRKLTVDENNHVVLRTEDAEGRACRRGPAVSEQYPPLTDSELDLAFREGATDEEIEFKLRDLMRWSYIMRDPLGKVCAVGRGTRPECIENAFRIADVR